MSILKAAANLARHGLAVFPCQPRGKCPLGSLAPHGVHDATRDPEIIRGWWREEPWANLGVAMGALSGHWALDVDVDHGGAESLAALEKTFGPLPLTVVSLTGGGGKHLLFRHPGGECKVRNLVGFYDGLDVRGDGGFVIAPPSVHPSGQRYRWAPGNPREPAEPPGWLLEIVKEPEGSIEVPEGRPQVRLRGNPAARKYVAAALRSAHKTIASAKPGTRNSTLNVEAFGIGQLVSGLARSPRRTRPTRWPGRPSTAG